MGINWVTFFAQIVNLFILVWLLKKFLYRPILNAVDKRQAEIMDRVQKARQEQTLAEEEHRKLLQKQTDFDIQKQKLYDATTKEVEDYKARQMSEIETEKQKLRQKMQHDLIRENETVQLEIRNLLADNFIALSRKIMSELSASTPLNQTIDLFEKKVTLLPKSQKEKIKKFYLKQQNIRIISSDDLSEDMKEKLTNFLKAGLDFKVNLNILFEKDASLILGIEMIIGDISLEWNLKNYLDEYHTNLNKTLSTIITTE